MLRKNTANEAETKAMRQRSPNRFTSVIIQPTVTAMAGMSTGSKADI